MHPEIQKMVISFFFIPDQSAIIPKTGLLRATRNVPNAPVNAHTTVAENWKLKITTPEPNSSL